MTSAIYVTAQMLTILIRKESLRQIASLNDDDFINRPELGDYGSTNYAEISQTVEPGAAATRLQADRLAKLALDDAAYEDHLAYRQETRRQAPDVDFITVVDDGPLSARVLETRLHSMTGNTPDANGLAQDAARLYGLDLYEQVDYKLVRRGDEEGIQFNTRSKSWGPNFLRFGVQLQDDLQGDTAFNLSARLTRRGLNRLGAEWRTDVQLGTEPYLKSEFYQPLSFDSRYFVAPRLLVEQTNFNAFVGQNSVAQYRVSE
jgi:NTE family protein